MGKLINFDSCRNRASFEGLSEINQAAIMGTVAAMITKYEFRYIYDNVLNSDHKAYIDNRIRELAEGEKTAADTKKETEEETGEEPKKKGVAFTAKMALKIERAKTFLDKQYEPQLKEMRELQGLSCPWDTVVYSILLGVYAGYMSATKSNQEV